MKKVWTILMLFIVLLLIINAAIISRQSDPVNIAPQATAFVSSGGQAAAINDNDIGTSWMSVNYPYTGGEGLFRNNSTFIERDPQYVGLEFNSIVDNITEIELVWPANAIADKFRAYQFEIVISNDGTDWFPLEEMEGHTPIPDNTVIPQPTPDLGRFVFNPGSPVSFKYIMIYFIKQTYDCNSPDTRFYLCELMVKQRNTTIPTPTPLFDYNHYYGYLHNHSTISDGKMRPPQRYQEARYTDKLDFYGLTEHTEANITDPSFKAMDNEAQWQTLQRIADHYTEDGNFIAFAGYEWTSREWGNYTVLNTDTLCHSADNNSLDALYSHLDQEGGIAFFNHPGKWDSAAPQPEFNHYSVTPPATPLPNIVGMELWNGTGAGSNYYNNTGYDSTNGLNHYQEALAAGWKIGAAGSLNHHTGEESTNKRLVIMADTLTRASLLEALNQRRYYTSTDTNMQISFQVDGMEMGSTLTEGEYQLKVTLQDNDAFTRVTLISLARGTGAKTETVYQLVAGTKELVYTENRDFTGIACCYLVIEQADGGIAISSPIFFEPATPVCTPWDIGVDYNVGDVVSYDGICYVCIFAHTSHIGWLPPETETHVWNKI